MKKRTKYILVALFLIVASYVGYCVWYEAQHRGISDKQRESLAYDKAHPPTRADLLKRINAERAKVGVAPLKIDTRLNTSAQMKADDMNKYHYFDHMRDGVFVGQEFINQTGIHCTLDSENIAGNSNDRDVVASWMSSKPHREAILDPKYTLTGFGFHAYGLSYYFVEHFCQP